MMATKSNDRHDMATGQVALSVSREQIYLGLGTIEKRVLKRLCTAQKDLGRLSAGSTSERSGRRKKGLGHERGRMVVWNDEVHIDTHNCAGISCCLMRER